MSVIEVNHLHKRYRAPANWGRLMDLLGLADKRDTKFKKLFGG